MQIIFFNDRQQRDSDQYLGRTTYKTSQSD